MNQESVEKLKDVTKLSTSVSQNLVSGGTSIQSLVPPTKRLQGQGMVGLSSGVVRSRVGQENRVEGTLGLGHNS